MTSKSTLIVFLFMLFFSVKSFSQWNFDHTVNSAVCIQPNNQEDVRIVTDTKGGGIITWLDFRNDIAEQSGDIFVQRINSAGFALWASNGVAICTNSANQTAPNMTEDESGGAIIVWKDWRNGNSDIYAQKVDSSGNILWAADGVPVCVKPYHQKDPRVISDGVGGAIVVWEDSAGGSWDVYAQHISNNGNILWGAAGLAVCSVVSSQINPRIETDGAFGAVIVWQDRRGGVEYDIYAQRINPSGLVQWPANGVVVCNSPNRQSNPKIEPDGAGGAIIAWQDKRNGVDYDIYAQRVDLSGAAQWQANGVVVCSAIGDQTAVDMETNGVSGVIISWEDERNNNFDIYAQKAELNGTISWAANGIPISTAINKQVNPNIIGDGSGGGIIVWQDSSAGNWDVKSQRVNGNGAVQWTAGGILVGSAAHSQTGPKNVSDGGGGSIYTWKDKRNGTDHDIYAHRIYGDGTAATIFEQNYFVESKCFPNPFSNSAVIEIRTPILMQDIDFLLFDILGKNIEIPFSFSENEIHISRGNIIGGIYFYEIRANQTLVSKGKLILAEEY